MPTTTMQRRIGLFHNGDSFSENDVTLSPAETTTTIACVNFEQDEYQRVAVIGTDEDDTYPVVTGTDRKGYWDLIVEMQSVRPHCRREGV